MTYPHSAFASDVSEDVISLLSYLNNPLQPIEKPLLLEIRSIINTEAYFKEPMASELIKLRFQILYRRYCNIVQHLINEYTQYSTDERKKRIDYYLFNNTLKELNFLGNGSFYDMKFKPGTGTLYKGHVECSNWQDKIKEKQGKKTNAEAVQIMFETCREHINMGGDVILKSYSKCFILDLFKYIALYEENGSYTARIIVKKNAPLNYIYANGKDYSLQQYIESNIPLENTEFILDFSEPRDYKRDNFNRWYKSFVGEDFKEANNSTFDDQTDFMSILLRQLMAESNPLEVSRMVSPVADREVIMTCDLWELVNYHPNRANDDVLFHFSFAEDALYELIFTYFITFFEQGNRSHLSPTFKVKVFEALEQLITTVQTTDSQSNATVEANVKRIITQLQHIQSLLCKEKQSKQVMQLLELVDWTYELDFWQPDNLDTFELKKIYNKQNENILINIFKYTCADIARRLYFDTY